MFPHDNNTCTVILTNMSAKIAYVGEISLHFATAHYCNITPPLLCQLVDGFEVQLCHFAKIVKVNQLVGCGWFALPRGTTVQTPRN